MPSVQRDLSLPSLGAIALGIAGIALASDLILQQPWRGPARRAGAVSSAGVAR